MDSITKSPLVPSRRILRPQSTTNHQNHMTKTQKQELLSEALTFKDERGRTSLIKIQKQSPSLYKKLMKLCHKKIGTLYAQISAHKLRLATVAPVQTMVPTVSQAAPSKITALIPIRFQADPATYGFHFCFNCGKPTDRANFCDLCGLHVAGAKHCLGIQ